MPLSDFFGKKPRRDVREVELDLELVTGSLGQSVPRREGWPAEPALVVARLADRCRDLGVPPTAEVHTLEPEAWSRLAVLVDCLDETGVLQVFANLVNRDGLEVVVEAMVGLARQAELLTLNALRLSATRREELARLLALGWGARLKGETVSYSRGALQRIDYARLLKNTELARQEAEQRLAALEELARRNVPRGKW